MPFDAASESAEQFAKLMGSHVQTPTVAVGEEAEPIRRPNGKAVFEHLHDPSRLTAIIAKYWRGRGFEVHVQCERIGNTWDFEIKSNLLNGMPS